MGLAVGDWWDLPANFNRAREIALEELAKQPASHNDSGDAIRHSEWMRRTTLETNSLTAWVAGTGHEIEGMIAGQPMQEMIMDLHNNAIGRAAGAANTQVDQSRLWTLPLNEAQYQPYQDLPAASNPPAASSGNNASPSYVADYFGSAPTNFGLAPTK